MRLEYATTVHSAQGGTRQVTHAVISERTDRHGLYVAMTRGRAENWAHTICDRPATGNDELEHIHDDPLAVLSSVLERDDSPDQHAAVTVRDEQADNAASLATLYPIWVDLLAQAGRARAHQALTVALDEQAADAILSGPSWPALAARLRSLGNAGIDAAAALAGAALRRGLEDAEDPAAVLHWQRRLCGSDADAPSAGSFVGLAPADAGALSETITGVARAMDARGILLAARAEADRPAWLDALGPIPDTPEAFPRWWKRVEVVAGYREAFDIRDDRDPIGVAPSKERPDAHAWWTRAVAALAGNRPLDMTAAPDTELDAIIERADQAAAAAPPPVNDQLRHTALDLRATQDAHGHALAAGDTAAAAEHAAAAEQLAERLAEIETAKTERDRWAATAASLEHQAEAARAEQRRRVPQHPYETLTTVALRHLLEQTSEQLTTTEQVTARYQTRTVDALAGDIDWLEAAAQTVLNDRPAET